jgi:hypothetical protein
MSTLANADLRQASPVRFPERALPAPQFGDQPLTWLCLILGAALVCGCGSDKPTYPSARLEGKVTVDGQPIAQGSLQFVPKDLGKASVTSAAIVEGRYVAEAVPRGSVRVLLSASKETGKMVTQYSTPRPEVINLIPNKYRSGISMEVSGDDPNANFELKSH